MLQLTCTGTDKINGVKIDVKRISLFLYFYALLALLKLRLNNDASITSLN